MFAPQARELNRSLLEGTAVQDAAVQRAAPAAGVGDGGASWRLKALRRAQATAKEQGCDVREVRPAPSKVTVVISGFWKVLIPGKIGNFW